MRKIGITGAFGLLGANFISALLGKIKSGDPEWADIQIIAFASNTTCNPKFSSDDVETRFLDILDYGDVVRNFEGLDCVVHFAGKIDDTASSKEKIWDTNVIGTKNVFDASLAREVKRILYASSICVLGGPGENLWADERSSPYGDPRWPVSFSSEKEALACAALSDEIDPVFFRKSRAIYFDSKLAAVELARDYYRARGLPVVTIYPGTVVGMGDMHNSISKLVNRVWNGELNFTFEGGSSFVTGDDLAEGSLLALGKGRPGDDYIISGSDELNLKYAEFQRLVMAAAGRKSGPIVERPIIVPHNVATKICGIASFLNRRTSLTSSFAYSGSVHNFCSSAKARRELGYAPKDGLAGAIVECRRFSETLRWQRARHELGKYGLAFSQ